MFTRLTIAAIIPGYAFLVHGHIPHNITNLEELNNLDEHTQVYMELLWNDPATTREKHSSFRRENCYYVGTDQVNRFLTHNDLQWVIRGHEKPDKGYETIGQTFTLHTTGPQTTYLKLPANPTKPPSQYIKQI